MNKKDFIRLLILNLFTSGHCTITYIALSMSLSYIVSNSIFVFSFFTGLYLMSMGIGALLVEKLNVRSERLVALILLNSLLGVFLANPGIPGIIVLNEFGRYLLRAQHIDLLWGMFPLGIVLTILIGVVSGAELPIFSKLIEQEGWHVSKPIIGVLAGDYFGAFAGIVLFTFILNPFAGLINAIFVSQIITLGCVNFSCFTITALKKRFKVLPFLISMNVYVLLMYLWRDRFVQFIDAVSSF